MILNAATAADIEQKAQMLKNVAIALGVIAASFLILSVILFIKLEIKRVIGEKTGRVERKSIQQLEQEAALSGKLQMNRSGKRVKKGQTSQMKVQDIFTNLENEEIPTELPSGTDTTAPLGNDATDVLYEPQEETAVLNSGYNETSVLGQEALIQNGRVSNVVIPPTAGMQTIQGEKVDVGNFRIIKDITLIHTNESI